MPLKSQLNKLRPPKLFKFVRKHGKLLDWNDILHTAFNALMPFSLVVLINSDLTQVALAVVFLSKWRMFSMRLNHLPANIRANLTDLIVKLSTFSFMVHTQSVTIQVMFASWYAVWLLLFKPQTSQLWVAVQAMISQLLGITALMWLSDQVHEVVVLAGIWTVIYATTVHYLSDFDERLARVLAKIWATIGLELAWIFLHWNLAYFSLIPQYVLVQGALSTLAADIYRSSVQTKPDFARMRIYIIATIAVVTLMILTADWQGQLA